MVGGIRDVITCAEFQMEIFMGYDFTGGRIFDFPIDFSMGLTTVQRYCAACDIQVRVYFTFTLHSSHPNPGNKMIWRARHFSKKTYFNRLRHISLIICLCFFMSVSFLMSFLPCAVFYVFLPFWRIPSITDRLLDCLHKFTWLFFWGGGFFSSCASLTSSWPHLRCDVGLEEGEYK